MVRSSILATLALLLGAVAVSAVQAQAPVAGPPNTLWSWLGFHQPGNAALLNKSGNFPGLEKKPPLMKIADPKNLQSQNPAIKKAAEIKAEEDLAQQKIKALKYLGEMGCGCYPGVSEALLAALEDCTESVRYEAAKALLNAANKKRTCRDKLRTAKIMGCHETAHAVAVHVIKGAGAVVCACKGHKGPDGKCPIHLHKDGHGHKHGDDDCQCQSGCPCGDPDSCCSEEVSKKLAEVAYEKNDSGCWKEPSERVRQMAREALMACCPGGPGLGFEQAPIETVNPPVPETTPTETVPAPETVPGVPMPPVPAPAPGPMTSYPSEGDEHYNPVRRVHPSSVIYQGANYTRLAPEAPTVAERRPVKLVQPPAVSERRSVRIINGPVASIAPQPHPVVVTPAPAEVEPAHAPTPAAEVTISESVDQDSGPFIEAARPVRTATKGHVQRASSQEDLLPVAPMPMSMRSQQPQPQPQPQQQQTVAAIRGKVVGIDSDFGQVILQFNGQAQPVVGTTIKVFHTYLTGEQCIGALEVVRRNGNQIVTQPLGTLGLNKIHRGDDVMFNGVVLSSMASN